MVGGNAREKDLKIIKVLDYFGFTEATEKKLECTVNKTDLFDKFISF